MWSGISHETLNLKESPQVSFAKVTGLKEKCTKPPNLHWMAILRNIRPQIS